MGASMRLSPAQRHEHNELMHYLSYHQNWDVLGN